MKSPHLNIILLLALLLQGTAVSGETVFNHVWSGFATSLANRSAEQRQNAVIAGRVLDGVIIPPGGLFSFNELVGARDREKGFVAAPHLNSSGMPEETPGGGICQLASTIYNAGLLAGLEIVERHPHSRVVLHVPPGRDATISSWRKDLKLRNPFPHPLLLRVSAAGERLTASFRSTVERDFLVEIRIRRTPLEPGTVMARNAAPSQSGQRGYSTSTWRITRKQGSETSELISEDTYPAPSRILGRDGT